MNDNNNHDELIDPDPFVIGLGLIQVVAAGAAFLEARRRNQVVEVSRRSDFRHAWFQSRRSLIFFQQSLSEFETYLLEEGFGSKEFRMGTVRLMLDGYKHQAMRRLHGQTATTASHMADNMDNLSNYLGADDQERVDEVLTKLAAVEFPKTYRDVIAAGREAVGLYTGLLERIEEREGFETEGN